MMIELLWHQKARYYMPQSGIRRTFLMYLILPLLMALSFLIAKQCQAAESLNFKLHEKSYAGIDKHKINSNFSVRGWKLTPNVYFGQTRTFGNTGYGLLIDTGDYAYGLIDHKISILKSF